jgi:hypothetical protein
MDGLSRPAAQWDIAVLWREVSGFDDQNRGGRLLLLLFLLLLRVRFWCHEAVFANNPNEKNETSGHGLGEAWVTSTTQFRDVVVQILVFLRDIAY